MTNKWIISVSDFQNVGIFMFYYSNYASLKYVTLSLCFVYEILEIGEIIMIIY